MILAIETSCDESAVALFDPARGLIGEWIHSQIAIHERHGGVVPDLATREHLRTVESLLGRAREASHGFASVTEVAVTQGPGLAGCLAVGLASAKALALALGCPVKGVNHLRGHVWSPFIGIHAAEGNAERNGRTGAGSGAGEGTRDARVPDGTATDGSVLGGIAMRGSGPDGSLAGGRADAFEARLAGLLPHLALVVSGGNTLLAVLDEQRRITVLSSTRDDAAGEALDKGAKLLGLGYPGGPIVERWAAGAGVHAGARIASGAGEDLKPGRVDAYDFPRGLGPRAELDFSFSGLKTALRYQLEKMTPAEVEAGLADICASYQQAVIDALVRKAGAALERGGFRSVGLSGGVANNKALRAAMATLAARRRIPLLAAAPRHTGDNAGMIAFAAWADPATKGLPVDGEGAALEIQPGWELGAA